MGLKLKVVSIDDGFRGMFSSLNASLLRLKAAVSILICQYKLLVFTLFKQELMAALFKQNRVFVVILWRDSPNRARSYFGFNLS